MLSRVGTRSGTAPTQQIQRAQFRFYCVRNYDAGTIGIVVLDNASNSHWYREDIRISGPKRRNNSRGTYERWHT